tara:strand:+ start:303 stop:425 length:123 start_codon:yes stop_codon:yes gene_type:complete
MKHEFKLWRELAYRFTYMREMYMYDKQKRNEHLWVAGEEE